MYKPVDFLALMQRKLSYETRNDIFFTISRVLFPYLCQKYLEAIYLWNSYEETYYWMPLVTFE